MVDIQLYEYLCRIKRANKYSYGILEICLHSYYVTIYCSLFVILLNYRLNDLSVGDALRE